MNNRQITDLYIYTVHTPDSLTLWFHVQLLHATRCNSVWTVRWLRGPAVEHWSLADVLSLSCARLAADGWPLMWESHPL